MKSDKVNLFGKEVNSLMYFLILGGYMFFMIVFLGFITNQNSAVFSLFLAAIPFLLAVKFGEEIFPSRRTCKFVLYACIIIMTSVYLWFFMKASVFVKGLYYVIYFVYGYLISKEIDNL